MPQQALLKVVVMLQTEPFPAYIEQKSNLVAYLVKMTENSKQRLHQTCQVCTAKTDLRKKGEGSNITQVSHTTPYRQQGTVHSY